MSGLDYSKWDRMANDMSDSDEEHGRPEVTTFDQPQSVTFGGTPASSAGEGSVNSRDAFPSSSPLAAPIDGSEGGAEKAASDARTAVARPKTRKALLNDEQLAENGAAVYRSANGGQQVLHYVWRQTRAEVTIVIPVPKRTRAGDVKVSLTAKPETLSEGVGDLIRVSLKATGPGCVGQTGATAAGAKGKVSSIPLLEGELAYQAALEAEDGGGVDWELKDYPGTIVVRDSIDAGITPAEAIASDEEGKERSEGGSDGGDRRSIEIVLRKHCPVPNAAVWWKSLLKGGPEIDVSTIKGRATNKHQSVWEEALGMFKDKMAAKKAQGKISVDTGEED